MNGKLSVRLFSLFPLFYSSTGTTAATENVEFLLSTKNFSFFHTYKNMGKFENGSQIHEEEETQNRKKPKEYQNWGENNKIKEQSCKFFSSSSSTFACFWQYRVNTI